jgi:hypothetical protein
MRDAVDFLFLVVFEEGGPFREGSGRPQRQTSGAGRGAR